MSRLECQAVFAKDFSFMNNGWRLIAVEGEEKFYEVGLTWGKGLSATHAAQRRKGLYATQNEDISWFFHAPSSAFCLSPLDACVSVRTAPAALVSSDQKLNAACLLAVCGGSADGGSCKHSWVRNCWTSS